jgi:hypothetical protein
MIGKKKSIGMVIKACMGPKSKVPWVIFTTKGISPHRFQGIQSFSPNLASRQLFLLFFAPLPLAL